MRNSGSTRIYGPYYRKDGRQHVILVSPDGVKKTVSYPKFLKEQALGRCLDPNEETVDHVDRNPANNDLSNLRLLSRSAHAAEDATRVKSAIVNCVICDRELKRRPNDVEGSARKGKAGPFCKSCAGYCGTQIQKGYPRFPVQSGCPVSARVYYKREKSGV